MNVVERGYTYGQMNMGTITYWLSLSMIFIIPWENMIDVEGVGTLSRAMGLVVAASWVATVVSTRGLRKPRPIHLVFFLFVLWNGVSFLWSLDRDTTLERTMTYFQLAFFVLILWDIYSTRAALRAALQSYVFGAYVGIMSVHANYAAGIEEGYQRFTATGFDSNEFALHLALGMAVAWYLIVSSSNDYRRKLRLAFNLLNYAYIPTAAWAIFLTGSRMGMLAIVPTLLFMLGSLGRIKLPQRVLFFAGLIAYLYALPSLVPQSSVQRLFATGKRIMGGDELRIEIWREGIFMFSAHPVVGVGSGAFRAANIETGNVPHNFVVSLLAELGIIGFSLFAIILAMILYHAIYQPRQDSRLWITILIIWLIGNAAHNMEAKKVTWLFWGLVISSASVFVPPDESRRSATLPIVSIASAKTIRKVKNT